MLRKAGFKNLVGMDLKVPRIGMIAKARGAYRHVRPRPGLAPSYRLVRGNIQSTPFEESSFDAAVCLSVVEHNIDLEKFFSESSRILKDGARMYLSTDYWDPKIDTSGIFFGGVPWNIFDKTEVEQLVDIGHGHGFSIDDAEVSSVSSPLVYAKGKHYTFVSMIFTLSKL